MFVTFCQLEVGTEVIGCSEVMLSDSSFVSQNRSGFEIVKNQHEITITSISMKYLKMDEAGDEIVSSGSQ